MCWSILVSLLKLIIDPIDICSRFFPGAPDHKRLYLVHCDRRSRCRSWRTTLSYSPWQALEVSRLTDLLGDQVREEGEVVARKTQQVTDLQQQLLQQQQQHRDLQQRLAGTAGTAAGLAGTTCTAACSTVLQALQPVVQCYMHCSLAEYAKKISCWRGMKFVSFLDCIYDVRRCSQNLSNRDTTVFRDSFKFPYTHLANDTMPWHKHQKARIARPPSSISQSVQSGF